MKQRRSYKRKRTLQPRDADHGQPMVDLPVVANLTTTSPQFWHEFRRPAFTPKPVIGRGLVRAGFSSRFDNDVPGRQSNIAVQNSVPQQEIDLQSEYQLPRRDSEEDYIVIPPMACSWELSTFPFSTRLTNILATYEFQHLGDLHGLRFSRILRWRNMGAVTLWTLITFVKRVQQGDWGLGLKPNLAAWPPDQEM